ncbi:hypothetical protein M9Y10_009030 [Tritrichomonas musculus]|uniref:cDENN domain-containing protein n=1 Tax=Tritrichomonas musculus TaxID=1915356 RepID=A0ABR2J1M3_9EUKA
MMKQRKCFNHFYILGPEAFNSNCDPKVLYQYPNEYKKGQKDSKKERNRIEDIVFPDGTHFIENDLNYNLMNEEYEELIFTKNNPRSYHYAIRFRCSPFTRPAAFNMQILDEILAEKQNIDEAKKEYVKIMKQYFMNDIILYKSSEMCPTCLFAFCIETDDPFHDFYFEVLRQLINTECSSAQNYSIMLNPQKENDNSRNNKDDDNDDFVLIEKVENISDDNIFVVSEIKEPKNQKESYHKVCDVDQLVHELNSFSNESSAQWPENSLSMRENYLEMIYNGNITNEMKAKIDEIIKMKFKPDVPVEMQFERNQCIYGAKELFEFIEVHDLLRIIGYLFLEYNVIVFGSELESITRTVSFLNHIVSPFHWEGTVNTILPNNSLPALQLPSIFIAGIFKNHKNVKNIFENQFIDKGYSLIIDLDECDVTWPANPSAEIPCSKKYIKSLKKFCNKKENQLRLNRTKSDVFIIREKKTKTKGALYPKLDKIPQVIDCLLSLNYDVFLSKFEHYFTNGMKKQEIQNKYHENFKSNKNDADFINEFLKGQAFASYYDYMNSKIEDSEVYKMEICES